MLQAGLEVSTYFEVIRCTAGSEDLLLAGKGMNAKPAGTSSQPQQKLPRMSCGAAEETLKLIYAPNPSAIPYWTLICFTEEYL